MNKPPLPYIADAGYTESPPPERFTVMGDGNRSSIPWAMIAPHEDQARFNHSQTLRRLQERGGLSVTETVAILDGEHWTETEKKYSAYGVQLRLQVLTDAWEALVRLGRCQ